MTVRLESLRYDAALDASKYVQGAQAKVQADKQMVDGAVAVEQAVQQTDRRIGQSSSGFEKIRNGYDAASKAAADYVRATKIINTAYDRGKITDPITKEALTGNAALQERDRLLQLAANRYTPFIDASNKAAKSIKLTYTEMEILRAGVINTAQSLASGMGAWRTFETQLFQTAPAFPALIAGIGGATLAAGAAGLSIAGAFGMIAARAISVTSEIRGFSVALRGMGRDSVLSANQLHALVETMRDSGLSLDESRQSALSLARGRNVSAGVAGQIGSITADFAAGSGQDVGAATKSLVEIADKGWPAIQQLDQQYRFLTTDQYTHIRALEDQGRATEAAEITIKALQDRMRGLAEESRGPMQDALHELGRSWDGLIDKIAASETALKSVQAAAWAINQIANMGPGVMRRALVGEDTTKSIITPLAKPANQNGQASALTAEGNAAAKLSFDLADEMARRQRVLDALPSQRPIVQAQVTAEQEATQKNYSLTERETLVAARQQMAEAERLSSLQDSNRELQLQIDLSLKAADAYGRGTAVGVRADAERTATLESLRTGINAADKAQQIMAQTVAQAAIAGAQALVTLRDQTASLERLADAAGNGATAENAVNTAERVRQATLEQTIALQNASGASEGILRQQIAETTDQIMRQVEAQKKLDAARGLRAAKADTQMSMLELGASQISNDDERHQAELAIERQRKLSELRDKYGGNETAINAELSEFDTAQANRDLARFYDDVRQQSRQLSSDMSSSFISGFQKASDSGQSIFRSFWGGVESIAESAVNRMAQMILEKAVFSPLADFAVGGFSDLFGIVGASSGVGYGGHRAAGGSVYGGQAYVVGERGPEIYVPSTAGTIVPNGGGASGGVSLTISPVINVTSSGGDLAGSTAQAKQMEKLVVNTVQSVVSEEFRKQSRPGGQLYGRV
jgi:phage-related minor tail protein